MSELTPEDRLAIQDVLHRYCHALDHGRWEQFAALFTEDCCLDLRPVLGRYEGAAGIREFCDTIRGVALFMRHLVLNIVVEGDGARARTAAYVVAITGPPGSSQQQTTGLYEDELVKRGARWLLHRRHLALDVPPA